MTVPCAASLQAGGTIINGISAIDSNETATVDGVPGLNHRDPVDGAHRLHGRGGRTNSVYVPPGGTWIL